MKFQIAIPCQKCGRHDPIDMHLDDGSCEWKCHCGEKNFVVLGAAITVGYRLLYRSEFEYRQRTDYSMAIVMAATAVDCELSRLFLKWQQIAALRANTDPNDTAIEQMLRRFKSVAEKIEKVCRVLDPRGIDEFVRSSDSLREAIKERFPSLHIGRLSKDFQEKLFWPRNRILHAGYAKHSDADAARCYSFAQLALHILLKMDEAKRQSEEQRLTLP